MKPASHLTSITAATVLLLTLTSTAQAQAPATTSAPVAKPAQTGKSEIVKKAARFLSFFEPSTVWYLQYRYGNDGRGPDHRDHDGFRHDRVGYDGGGSHHRNNDGLGADSQCHDGQCAHH